MNEEQIVLFKNVIIPALAMFIALASVCVAFLTLRYSRKDRTEAREYLKEQKEMARTEAREYLKEQKEMAESASRRKQQEEIFEALRGGKESVGFMALQLSRSPDIVSKENMESILNSLCLAYIFDSSSRARAFVLKALRVFSKRHGSKIIIVEILKEIEENFSEYDDLTAQNELDKYKDRIKILTEQFKN